VKYIYWAHLFIGHVYLLGLFIYWVCLFIGCVYLLGAFIYSVCLCNKCVTQLDKTMVLDFPSTPTPTHQHHRSPPLDLCNSTSANLEGSAQLNRRVSWSTLLQRHPPKPTFPKNNLVILTSHLLPSTCSSSMNPRSTRLLPEALVCHLSDGLAQNVITTQWFLTFSDLLLRIFSISATASSAWRPFYYWLTSCTSQLLHHTIKLYFTFQDVGHLWLGYELPLSVLLYGDELYQSTDINRSLVSSVGVLDYHLISYNPSWVV